MVELGINRVKEAGKRVGLPDDFLRLSVHQHEDLRDTALCALAVRDLPVALTEHAEKMLIPLGLR